MLRARTRTGMVVTALVAIVTSGKELLAQPAPSECTGFGVSFEITQATQTFPFSTIDLVDGRRTGVRVYALGSPYPCQGPMVDVRLTSVPGSLSRPAVVGWSENGPKLLKSSADREQENDTFNFELTPSGWEGESYTFTAELFRVNNQGLPELTLATASTTRPFVKACPPDIAGVRVAMQQFSPPFDEAPPIAEVRPGIADAMMWGVYPFPEYGVFSHGGGYRLDPDVLEIPSDVSPTSNQVFFDIDSKRSDMDPKPDFLIGWLKRTPMGLSQEVSGQATLSGETSWTRVSGGGSQGMHVRTTTMEVGHNFGYEHHDFGLPIDEVGWDVKAILSPLHLKRRDYSEYMLRPDGNAWTGSEAYVGLFGNPRVNQCAPRVFGGFRRFPIIPIPTPIPPREPSWTIGTSSEMSSVGRSIVQSNEGRARLEVYDNVGAQLYSTSFNPEVPCHDSEDCTTTEDVAYIAETPAFVNAHSAKLFVDGIRSRV